MKFYDCSSAPSPRRARMFIAEKGLDLETLQVDLMNGEQFTPEFRRINPRCTVPVLELDDGTMITENQGIARYFEEICPQPVLLGGSAKEKALVASWNARAEFEGLLAVGECVRNSFSGFENRGLTGPLDYAQIPALAKRGRRRTAEFLALLDEQLADKEFICGANFSMADICAYVTVDFARWIKVPVQEEQRHLTRWYAAIKARPSAAL